LLSRRYYVLAVIVIPVLFYLPKFFELTSREEVVTVRAMVNCSEYLRFRGDHPGFQGLAQQSMVNFHSKLSYPEECGKLSLAEVEAGEEIFNVTRRFRRVLVRPTKLRENVLYYQVYWLGLNTAFGLLLPLTSLLYLNVRTVRALKAMMLHEEEANAAVPRIVNRTL